MRCQPPIILSGPSCQARVWALVQERVDAFAIQHKSSRASRDLLTNDAVLSILQFGSSAKTLFWSAITDVQDALFYNRNGISLEAAVQYTLDKAHSFEDTFGPLLDQCARDFLLLSEKSQIGYSESSNTPSITSLRSLMS